MLKTILSGVISFIVGVALTMVIMWNMAPSMMMLEDVCVDTDFDTTIEKLEKSVADHGWKIPVTHDLQESMLKSGLNVKSVKVIELCHPDHAGKILAQDDERIVSALMPCRVAIYEKNDGKVYVSRMNSALMSSMMDGIIPEVMKQAAVENEAILAAILPN